MFSNKPIQVLTSIVILIVAVVFLYRDILFVPADAALYPWASDTLGHVMKVEYLLEQVSEGHPLPTLFPGWYIWGCKSCATTRHCPIFF